VVLEPTSRYFEALNPNNQFLIQSMMDLPGHFQLDVIPWHVGNLPDHMGRGYFTTDLRLAWEYQKLELSVVGHELGSRQHIEFGTNEIPRSVYGKVALRL
jgi:hypothetical protein